MDTIAHRDSWIHRYPHLAERGEGLLIILDPAEVREAPDIQDRVVNVRKPDGSASQYVVASAETHHSVVGLFFKGVSSEDIPRGSLIEW